MARTPFRELAILALTLVWGLSHAQNSDSYEPDPPDRAARLSYLEGDVSLQPAGEGDWAPAILNRPLTTGDKLWAERGSRAEIQVGPAAVRLGGNTGFSFLNVDDNTIQMRVTAGVLNVSVRTLRDSEQIEIDTPNVALTLLRPGNYRVEVNDAGDSTVVKVSEGALQATGPSQDVVVHDQQAVTFDGVDELVAQYGTLGAPDEFDSWNLERDRYDERASSSRTAEYVSPDVTGYEDLDDNGTWSSEAEYGYVWTPTRVVVGWAPYQFGRWVWVSPWGWTWIDDARWGYAPFHYGRWASIRNRWCWVPGPRHVRAVYAPALVGWNGGGAHVSWFPLGPREVYMPGRHYSRHYLERVNFSNTYLSRAHFSQAVEGRIADSIYRNRSVPGGVTAMPRNAFTSAGRTRDNRVRVSEQDVSAGVASAIAPRIAPVRESRLGGPARANVRVPPASLANRQVVVKRDPPPAAEHFARRPMVTRDVERPPNRTARPAEPNGVAAALRERTDRPPRVERPVGNVSAPAVQSSVFDRNTLSSRVREDRDRQGRETQQREAAQQRDAQQQREAVQRREASQPRDDSQQRQSWQDNQAREQRDVQTQLREQLQRQQQNTERRSYGRQMEQRERPEPREREAAPRVERPVMREQPVQREQPVHREQPVQREQPQQREHNSERSQSDRSESRSQPHSRDDNSRMRR